MNVRNLSGGARARERLWVGASFDGLWRGKLRGFGEGCKVLFSLLMDFGIAPASGEAGSRPGGRLTCLLLRQKKVSKEKATRQSGSLR